MRGAPAAGAGPSGAGRQRRDGVVEEIKVKVVRFCEPCALMGIGKAPLKKPIETIQFRPHLPQPRLQAAAVAGRLCVSL